MRGRWIVGAVLLQFALASVVIAAKTQATAIPIEGMT